MNAGDTARYFAPEARWHEHEHWLASFARERVLDIGAGAGRVSIAMQRRGLEVTALDTSPGAAEVCRRRGVREVFEGSIYGLRATVPAPFGTFLLFGNNLGLLASQDEAPRFLAALAGMSAPGAVILGTGLDPYRTLDATHHANHAANRAAGRMGGQSLLERTVWKLQDHRSTDSGGYAAVIGRD